MNKWLLTMAIARGVTRILIYQTCMMELFAEIVHSFQPLSIFAKGFMAIVWQNSKYASAGKKAHEFNFSYIQMQFFTPDCYWMQEIWSQYS